MNDYEEDGLTLTNVAVWLAVIATGILLAYTWAC